MILNKKETFIVNSLSLFNETKWTNEYNVYIISLLKKGAIEIENIDADGIFTIKLKRSTNSKVKSLNKERVESILKDLKEDMIKISEQLFKDYLKHGICYYTDIDLNKVLG